MVFNCWMMASALSTPLGDVLADEPSSGFERLVREHQDRIFGFALNLCGNAADAEEIAQDAFIRAHRALGGYEAQRVRDLKVSSWLHQIALNVFRNRIRGRRPQIVGLDDIAEPPTIEPGPERIFEMGVERDRLRSLLVALPVRYREAVVLRHVQGLSYAEMAAVLDLPLGTLKSDVHRGLALLRKELSR